MKKIKRLLQAKIEAKLGKGKVLVLYGPRQVGKTTLVREILRNRRSDRGYFNCEEALVRDTLLSMDSTRIFGYFSGSEIIALDEAQSLPNVGRAIKILADSHPELNIIATGSSSFELANVVSEPLTGRKFEFFLPPISLEEMKSNFGNAAAVNSINDALIYGSYPEIATSADDLDLPAGSDGFVGHPVGT